MKLPFSLDEFLYVFEEYNRAIWPAQIVAYLIGILVVVAALGRFRASGRAVSAGLGLMWIWIGATYHLMFFHAINPAATIFGILFIVQGLLFLLIGFVRTDLTIRLENTPAGWLGAAMILYAMVGYPWLSHQYGHAYPAMPVFGVTPCPTTIFTLGVILWGAASLPRVLLVIPLVWSAVAAAAAVSLGMGEDLALPVSALVTVVLFVEVRLEHRRHHLTGAPT